MPRNNRNRRIIRYDNEPFADEFPPHNRRHSDKHKKNFKHAAKALINQYAPVPDQHTGESWVRVTVIHGANLNRQFICQGIMDKLGIRTKIFNIYSDIHNLLLYLKMRSRKIGEFREALKTLIDPQTQKFVSCDVTPLPEPGLPAPKKGMDGDVTNPLPQDWVTALKTCFHARFNTANMSLDMSNLHNDPDLQSLGLYLPLNKSLISQTFISILIENQANLKLLNMTDSRLTNVSFFSKLANSGVSIQKIDLSGNPISSVTALTGLRSVDGLVSLELAETPLNYNKETNRRLIDQLTNLLPSIRELNGKPISAQDTIEVSKPTMTGPIRPLPTLIQGFFPNENVKMAVLLFLKQYYQKFDSSNRGDALLPYYFPDSVMTLSILNNFCSISQQNNYAAVSINIGQGKDKQTSSRLIFTTQKFCNVYIEHSRNLIKFKGNIPKDRCLNKGPLQIANVFKSLPETEHLLETFSVDVITCSSNMMMVHVSGIFYEIQKSPKEIKKIPRCFTRSLTITAPDETIAHDIINISNPNDEICKKFIREMRDFEAQRIQSSHQTSTQSNSITTNNGIVMPNISGSTISQDPYQESLVMELKSRSGMNTHFSRQCLSESNWDMNIAWSRFDVMNKAGQIPSEAFVN